MQLRMLLCVFMAALVYLHHNIWSFESEIVLVKLQTSLFTTVFHVKL